MIHFRLKILGSFIKHLADKENQQHKPTYAVKNSYSLYLHLHSIVFTFVLHISEFVYNHKCVQGAEVEAVSLFILLIHKLGPEGAAFQTGRPPAAASSSLPTCQSVFSPRATPSLSGGGVDISGIAFLPPLSCLFSF